MPINVNGTRMTRVQSITPIVGFQRQVIQNGVSVFFLQGWNFLNYQYGTNVQFSSTYTINVNTSVTDAFQLCSTYQSQAANNALNTLPGNIENYGHLAQANLDYQVFNSRFGQLVRCTIDYGYPPFLYQILDIS